MAGNINFRAVGAHGEDLALHAYLREGYILVARNWHFHRMGEIDLILTKGDWLVFCEVKLRKDPSFAEASLSVGPVKRARIRKLARCFLMQRAEYADCQIRFDVCEIIPDERGNLTVNCIPEAF